jgi:hypothetical protein
MPARRICFTVRQAFQSGNVLKGVPAGDIEGNEHDIRKEIRPAKG